MSGRAQPLLAAWHSRSVVAPQADTERGIRLAAGGPPLRDLGATSTAELRIRWLSALAFANRVTARVPTPQAAAAILELAQELDRRGALLAEVPAGPREERLAAAAERLRLCGVIARSPGLPTVLRDAASAEAVDTVRDLLPVAPTAPELLAPGDPQGYSVRQLVRLIDSARRSAAPGTDVHDDDLRPSVRHEVIEIPEAQAPPTETARPSPAVRQR